MGRDREKVPVYTWLRLVSSVLWFDITLFCGFEETWKPMTALLVICWVIAAFIQSDEIVETQKYEAERARQRAQDLHDILWNGKPALETWLQRDREDYERKYGRPMPHIWDDNEKRYK